MNGRVLIIAGSDSGGGAGIQADIKTVTALGGFAMTAITALTAQNTEGVHGVFEVDPDFVAQQIRVVLGDIGADVIKIGMLHSVDVIKAVGEALPDDIPIVLDPVMVAKGGYVLTQPQALAALETHIMDRVTLLAPNVPEAEALSGKSIRKVDDMSVAAEKLSCLGPKAVLVKGGHLDGDEVIDVLWRQGVRAEVFCSPRIESRHTHGTGCTLASAVATGLAQGMDLCASVKRARGYVAEAIRSAPGYGRGHGPLNHAHPCDH